ncbi:MULTISPECIES: membrane lipoprotein lipid attachment site-containing protein [unclassified Staphylococcus]|uniref:membrane lipoprotein lipid attachment site-containing protein n=1 Tax=unclassified Staphylococcus TaxID=91994 RepID=UPI0021CE5D76|nr:MULTISPECIES: membrane lipoprotein lipid attachment site-containing protein [unclassified Staphylococcus]UXR78468.1 membrane lipoprotein lipid attachment site-containing protein [Staphylococcus sp. IVB6227]UXR82626.1 membrane lipoprotein lipid attachment site-containing protein [Staphylococcus sp. IVB6214]
MKKILLGGITAMFLLTGCSNETNSKELKMGEVFNSGKEHISYITTYDPKESKGDAPVEFVIVSKKGETKLYNVYEGEYALGDFAKMKDRKIEDKALEADKKAFNTQKREVISSIKDQMESTEDELHELHKDAGDPLVEYEIEETDAEYDELNQALIKTQRTHYEDPEFKKMKLVLYTGFAGDSEDETGEEMFVFKKSNIFSDSEEKEHDLTLIGSIDPVDVHEKRYAGLYSNRGRYIVTEVGDKVEKSILDSKDDEYVDKVE